MTVSDEHVLDLSRARFELARASVALQDAIAAASAAGISQRAIATLVGTNQAAVHRMLARRRADEAGTPSALAEYARPEARFHLELHREVARHIRRGAWSRSDARARLEQIANRLGPAGSRTTLDSWRRILAMEPHDIVDAILADGEDGDDLRQLSPLVGLVTPEDRVRALRRAYRDDA